MKGRMKKLLLGLGLIALLAGCASSNSGMGGTSEESPQYVGKMADQYGSNATHGTGTSTATNSSGISY
jgi:hypothetical protein